MRLMLWRKLSEVGVYSSMEEQNVDTSILSVDQRLAWDALNRGENLFVTARAGAGKSFLIDFIRANFKGRVLTTASTGIAANNVGGRTLHSQFLINPGSPNAKESADKVDGGKRGYAVRSARLLIIDEISMVSDTLLECVSDICKMVRNSPLPFGGVQVALFGDFLQLPPVFKGSSANDKICWDCKCWKEANIKTMLMTSNFRQSGDDEFYRILTRLRYNKLTKADIERIRSRELAADDSAIRLFSTNGEVDGYNSFKFNKLDPSTERRFFATAYGDESLIRAYWKDSLIPEELVLRIGARVMMCKNKDVEGGYLFNGSLGEVVGFSGDGDSHGNPIVKFDSGIVYTVEEETIFNPTEKNERGFSVTLAEINQIPLRLAWACTVHKSQGQTFDKVMMDCSRTFLYGQVYVAFSRARTLEGLCVNGFNPYSRGSMSDPEIVARYIEMEQEAFERANPD